MNLIRIQFYLLLAVTCVSSSFAYILEARFDLLLLSALGAVLWGTSHIKSWRWISTACFLLSLFHGFRIAYFNGMIALAILTLLSALLCWNTALFHRRLKSASRVIHQEKIVKEFLFRLVLTSSISIIISLISAQLAVGINFKWILVLALVAIIAVGKMGQLSIRQSE